MTIRRATPSDLSVLADLNRQIQELHVAAEPGVYRRPAAGEIEAHLEAILAGADTYVLVADGDQGPVGFAIIRVSERGHVFVHRRRIASVDALGVHEHHRRRGWGRALMRAAAELARDLECEAIALSVRAFNEGALRFYESLGYRPSSHHLVRSVPR